jgi:hypothetical protein
MSVQCGFFSLPGFHATDRETFLPPPGKPARDEETLFLLFEKGFQRASRLLGFVHILPCRTLWDEIVTKIGTFLVNNSLRQNFPALIVSMRVIKLALFATPQVSVAVGTGVAPADIFLRFNRFSAKCAVHDAIPSDSYKRNFDNSPADE